MKTVRIRGFLAIGSLIAAMHAPHANAITVPDVNSACTATQGPNCFKVSSSYLSGTTGATTIRGDATATGTNVVAYGVQGTSAAPWPSAGVYGTETGTGSGVMGQNNV